MIRKSDALQALRPGAEWTILGDKIIWHDEEQSMPTDEEIDKKVLELQEIEKTRDYIEQRAEAYPSVVDQLDKIYHEGVDAWKAEIESIKNAYPKVAPDLDAISLRVEEEYNNNEFAKLLKEYSVAVKRLERHALSEGRPAREAVYEERWNGLYELPEDADLNTEPTKVYESVLVEPEMPAIPALPLTYQEYEVDEDGNVIYDEVDVVDEDGNPVTKRKYVGDANIPPMDRTDDMWEDVTQKEQKPRVIEVDNPAITIDNEERAAAQAIIDATPQEVIDAHNAEA